MIAVVVESFCFFGVSCVVEHCRSTVVLFWESFPSFELVERVSEEVYCIKFPLLLGEFFLPFLYDFFDGFHEGVAVLR